MLPQTIKLISLKVRNLIIPVQWRNRTHLPLANPLDHLYQHQYEQPAILKMINYLQLIWHRIVVGLDPGYLDPQ